ncbi:MAG: hypothetical protein RR144_03800 [Clostridia bacterium]
MGKKGGGLYENWLKHFTINVMTQSFHAFFLMFVMKMLQIISLQIDASATSLTASDGILSIMSIVGMMAIIKFEKLFKQLFGMGDSISGDLKGAGAKMIMGMNAAKSLSGEIGKPISEMNKSNKSRKVAGKVAGVADNKIGSGFKEGIRLDTNRKTNYSSDKAEDLFNAAKTAKSNGDMDKYKELRQQAADQMKYDRDGITYTSQATNNQGTTGTPVTNSSSTFEDLKEKNRRKQQQKKEEAYNDAETDFLKNRRKAVWKTAGTLTSLTLGMGSTDELSDALRVADVINNPINAASSSVIDHSENKSAFKDTGNEKYFERTIGTAIKEGLRDGTKNMRNDNGKLNPVKITVEGAKNYITAPYKIVSGASKASRPANVNNVDDL